MATRVSWGLEEMIISLVMPVAPQRFAYRATATPVCNRRRRGDGQIARAQSQHAAQDVDEDERH
jgi:hypothetical protein